MTSLPEDGIEIAVWNRLENRSDQLVGETAVQLIGSVRAQLPNGSVSGAPIADSNIRALRAINGATSGSSSSRPVGAFMFDCRSSASSMRYRTQHASIEAAGRWLTLATQFLCEPSSTSAAAPGRSTPLLPSLLPAVPHHHECYSYLQKRLLACAAKRKIGPRSSADHSRIPLTLETMWLLEQFAALFGIGDIYRQLVLLEDAIEFIRPVGPHLIALDRSLSVLRGRLTQVALTSQEVSMLSRSRSLSSFKLLTRVYRRQSTNACARASVHACVTSCPSTTFTFHRYESRAARIIQRAKSTHHPPPSLEQNTPRGMLSTLLDCIRALDPDGTIPDIADIVDVRSNGSR